MTDNSGQINQMNLCTDEELMYWVEKGQSGAFDELYSRYGRKLLAYLLRMLNFDREMAEDVLQDIFLKIAESPEKFDRSRSFRTWIFCVASNSCKNHYRHAKIVRDSHAEIRNQENSDGSLFSRISSGIDAVHFRKMLNEALNEMSAEKKEAFILKYQEDKTIAEIAEIQNCPEGSVKSRLHYCLKTLEEKLKIFKPV